MPRIHKGEKRQLYTKQVRGAWTQTLTVGFRTHQSLQSKARRPPSKQNSPQNSSSSHQMSPDPLTAQPPLLPHLVTHSGTLQHLVFMKGLYAAHLKCDQPSPVLQVVLLGLGLGTTTPISQMGNLP